MWVGKGREGGKKGELFLTFPRRNTDKYSNQSLPSFLIRTLPHLNCGHAVPQWRMLGPSQYLALGQPLLELSIMDLNPILIPAVLFSSQFWNKAPLNQHPNFLKVRTPPCTGPHITRSRYHKTVSLHSANVHSGAKEVQQGPQGWWDRMHAHGAMAP